MIMALEWKQAPENFSRTTPFSKPGKRKPVLQVVLYEFLNREFMFSFPDEAWYTLNTNVKDH
jgi:hypothetical protein